MGQQRHILAPALAASALPLILTPATSATTSLPRLNWTGIEELMNCLAACGNNNDEEKCSEFGWVGGAGLDGRLMNGMKEEEHERVARA